MHILAHFLILYLGLPEPRCPGPSAPSAWFPLPSTRPLGSPPSKTFPCSKILLTYPLFRQWELHNPVVKSMDSEASSATSYVSFSNWLHYLCPNFLTYKIKIRRYWPHKVIAKIQWDKVYNDWNKCLTPSKCSVSCNYCLLILHTFPNKFLIVCKNKSLLTVLFFCFFFWKSKAYLSYLLSV